MEPHPLTDDLNFILDETGPAFWQHWHGKNLFITGGTGFFGCWLIESLTWAADQYQLNTHITVLTRRPDLFAQRVPHLAHHSAVTLWSGDVCDFTFPDGPFSTIIHAAADTGTRLTQENPIRIFNTTLTGTQHVIDLALRQKYARMLFISSGAVYGRQPPDLPRIPETYAGGPYPLNQHAAYAESKRAAELLCSLHHYQHGLDVVIVRPFAFVGPYLPLQAHFAIGNFIHNGLNHQPIKINGDGTPLRSYLYASELAIWLWKILREGNSDGVYNIGSEEVYSIAQVADQVASHFMPMPEVQIAHQLDPKQPPERYIPSTEKVRTELGLNQKIDLNTAIERTIQWAKTIKGT